ncbi:hypothetical protein [Clostridium sp. Marseille-Q2269]|uniref:hypothetical protein n=1 Tax=Clostridium sp. Marseille-Q2269 TaxID=2942205 RepID=UPI002072B1F5|nr:hypothetical protein [Clostridium sp. Marseille-Q2269]
MNKTVYTTTEYKPIIKIDINVDLEKINKKIIALDLSPKTFNQGGKEYNITGNWGNWKIISTYDKRIIVKCPIESGILSFDNNTYKFSHGDYINISVKPGDFNKDQINYAVINFGIHYFSFTVGVGNILKHEIMNSTIISLFKDWFNNNLDKIKGVLNPLFIEKVNEEIIFLNLTSETFNQEDQRCNITGNWDNWQILYVYDTKIMVKCPIESGILSFDNDTYKFSHGDYINISVKPEDLNEDQMNNAVIDFGAHYFSFIAGSENILEHEMINIYALNLFKCWFNNNLNQIRRALKSLFGN